MIGRPSKETELTVKKLEEAFALDCSVEEACFYAKISRQTYYTWVKDDPALLDRFEELRQNPFLLARQTIVKSLTNPSDAQWYMERKKKKEFAQRVENTGKEGDPIELLNVGDKEFMEIIQKYGIKPGEKESDTKTTDI